MLLNNSHHVNKLVNGSIEIVKEIMFEHGDEPRHIPYELPTCIIVEFQQSTFAVETKWRTNVDKKSF